MADFTPSTDQVKALLLEQGRLGPHEFDRWLAEHNRQVADAERVRIADALPTLAGWNPAEADTIRLAQKRIRASNDAPTMRRVGPGFDTTREAYDWLARDRADGIRTALEMCFTNPELSWSYEEIAERLNAWADAIDGGKPSHSETGEKP